MRKTRRKPDITVPSGACITLERGTFGHIVVEDGGELRGGNGVVHIDTLKVGRKATVNCGASATLSTLQK